jgi:hypothetical protein
LQATDCLFVISVPYFWKKEDLAGPSTCCRKFIIGREFSVEPIGLPRGSDHTPVSTGPQRALTDRQRSAAFGKFGVSWKICCNKSTSITIVRHCYSLRGPRLRNCANSHRNDRAKSRSECPARWKTSISCSRDSIRCARSEYQSLRNLGPWTKPPAPIGTTGPYQNFWPNLTPKSIGLIGYTR